MRRARRTTVPPSQMAASDAPAEPINVQNTMSQLHMRQSKVIQARSHLSWPVACAVAELAFPALQESGDD